MPASYKHSWSYCHSMPKHIILQVISRVIFSSCLQHLYMPLSSVSGWHRKLTCEECPHLHSYSHHLVPCGVHTVALLHKLSQPWQILCVFDIGDKWLERQKHGVVACKQHSDKVYLRSSLVDSSSSVNGVYWWSFQVQVRCCSVMLCSVSGCPATNTRTSQVGQEMSVGLRGSVVIDVTVAYLWHK